MPPRFQERGGWRVRGEHSERRRNIDGLEVRGRGEELNVEKLVENRRDIADIRGHRRDA